MTPTLTRNNALLALGFVLLLTPALFPVQPMLYHDPQAGTAQTESELRRDGYVIIAYENLSDRGQELYRQALREGSVAVPLGTGAPDFEYPTGAELGAVEGNFEKRRALRTVVIERPPDAALPPPAEPVERAAEIRERHERREERREEGERGERTPPPTTNDSTGANETGTLSPTARQSTPALEEQREMIARYDLMTTATELPPLTAPPSLARLLVAMLGVVLIGVGGYRYSQP